MSGVEVLGRDAEAGSVFGFLGRAVEGPAALVLEGEPGIGKTTLWLAGVDYWRSLGGRVLSARPAEAERGLAHVGLGDLLEGVLDEVVARLSPPRRRALEGALLLDDQAPVSVDVRALGIAVRDVLQVLAEQHPYLIAIDDLQWLDPASVSALAFALRRLEESPVFLLLARRPLHDGQTTEVEQALPGDAIQGLSVCPLSIGALHAIAATSRGSRLRASDVAAHSRALGRESVLRARDRASARFTRRSDTATADSPVAGPACEREGFRVAGVDADGAGIRCCGRDAFRVPARACRRRTGGAGTCRGCGCDPIRL